MSQSSNEQKQITWHPNRAYIQLPNDLLIDSCFPSGNVSQANIISNQPLTIQIEGNTDVSCDTNSKYWLYFRIRGYKKDKPIKFILKNANHLRKYYGQTRYRPYMMYKEQQEQWQANPTPIDINIFENGHLQGIFTFQSQKYNKNNNKTNKSTNELYPNKEEKVLTNTNVSKDQNQRGDCYFAIFHPYSCDDLHKYLGDVHKKYIQKKYIFGRKAYYNQETVTYSLGRRKIPLITITSVDNIQSFSQKQPIISEELFPDPKERPHKLKNNPVIILTARVHPSQTYSSFFIQGLIDFLLSDSKSSSILRQLFIFKIIPMLNPDGVDHGNFRFDTQMRNLNRFYGQSSIQKTPSIRAAQLLISYYKNKNNQQCQFTQFFQQTYSRLFMYIDVHGHSSAMPSFIYGNHSDKIEHLIENKVFCKIIQNNFIAGGFSKVQSQFSKKNMTVQQKYDEFSKLCSGRVYAGRADSQEMNLFHSYTLELLPYWQDCSRRKSQKIDKLSTCQYSKLLGKEVMVSLLDLLDINPQSKSSQNQIQRFRRYISKECYNEQCRRFFLFKRAQSSVDRCSYSQISKLKNNNSQKENTYLNEYILRWFTNQIFLKHFTTKIPNLKQPKLHKFYGRLAKTLQIPIKDIQSPIKNRKVETQPRNDDKVRLYDSSRNQQQNPTIFRKSKCFVTRQERRLLHTQEKLMNKKQKGRVETKINKHTIELREQFNELVYKKDRFSDKQSPFKFQKREPMIKKESSKKDTIQSTQKYEKEVLNKIHSTSQKNPNAIFQIKVKEIKPKPKSNIRLHTQLATGECVSITAGNDVNGKIKNCNSQIGNFQLDCNQTNKQSQKHQYHRPSFIEEYILKIRQERQSLAVNSTKINPRQQLKNKIQKYRPSLKDQLQQPQKNILPVLRRNKIFTIASEPHKQRNNINDSQQHQKKRIATVQTDNIDQLVSKTKKILSFQKKEDYNRQNMLKQSQPFSDYAFL